ncbi:uncharacterized protein [Bemisia tabaci]
MAAGLLIKDTFRMKLPRVQRQFQILMPNSNAANDGKVQMSDSLDKSEVTTQRVNETTGEAAKLLPSVSKPSSHQDQTVANAISTNVCMDEKGACNTESDSSKQEACEKERKVIDLAEIVDDDRRSGKKMLNLNLNLQDCKDKIRDKCELAGKRWSEASFPGKLSEARLELKKKMPDWWKTVTCSFNSLQENVAKKLGKRGD